MADLFQKDRKTITEHIGNVFKEGELEENSVCRKFQHTALDGKTYNVNSLLLRYFRPERKNYLSLIAPILMVLVFGVLFLQFAKISSEINM